MIREEPRRLGVWGGQAGGCGCGSGSNASGADVFYAGRQTFLPVFWQVYKTNIFSLGFNYDVKLILQGEAEGQKSGQIFPCQT